MATYYFLVTEYVPGTDLRKYVRQHGPLDMRAAATIISQAAKGLGHAHEQGLIHRDVKPGNLLVTPEGKTKVSDLGLGRLDERCRQRSAAGKIVGTADYLSPEQILTPRQVTPTSDIYSLGCTLYYAVTGKVPFPGGTTRDKARRHLEDMPLHPRRLNPELTDKFVDVIAEMMEKKPRRSDQDRRRGRQSIVALGRRARCRAAAGSAGDARISVVFLSTRAASTIPTAAEKNLSALPETDWQLDDGHQPRLARDRAVRRNRRGDRAGQERHLARAADATDTRAKRCLILAFAGTLAGFALLLTLIHLIIK